MKKKRVVVLFFTMLLLFFGVDARLCYLALTDDGNTQTAATHGSFTLNISSERGTIYDRNMNPIVDLTTKYVAVVSPGQNIALQLAALSPHVSDQSLLMNDLKKGLPFTITVDTPTINATGINVIKTQERYGANSIAPHITGYVDGDGNGVSGIEKAFDDVLKKYTGTVTETFAVDARQHTLSGVTPQIVTQGNNSGGVVLTLDKQIQLDAQKAAGKYLKSGAVIVMDIKTGDILASVSEPEYSPADVSAAINLSTSPLINRAFTSYNLGSIFKIAVASTALQSGISPSFTYTCTGSVVVDGRTFRCEKTTGHGTEDMSLAFANSCNTYFITVGEKVGGAKLLQMAKLFGFGTPTVLAPGLSTDAGGLPTANELIEPAAVGNFSIGQGDLMVTPVQVADMVSAVANGGMLPTARLVKGIYSPDGKLTEYPGAVPDRVIPSQIAETVKSFMITTVNGGTGMPAKPAYGGAGGKTSTAQTGWVQNGKAVNQAWFAGFYPAQSPKYAIVAICENGTAGGADAGPVFKYIANCLAPSCGYPTVTQ